MSSSCNFAAFVLLALFMCLAHATLDVCLNNPYAPEYPLRINCKLADNITVAECSEITLAQIERMHWDIIDAGIDNVAKQRAVSEEDSATVKTLFELYRYPVRHDPLFPAKFCLDWWHSVLHDDFGKEYRNTTVLFDRYTQEFANADR